MLPAALFVDAVTVAGNAGQIDHALCTHVATNASDFPAFSVAELRLMQDSRLLDLYALFHYGKGRLKPS